MNSSSTECVGKGVVKLGVTNKSHLITFLCCIDKTEAPVSKLRGLDHVVRYIWELVSDEWLDLHIERFPEACVKPYNIARLTLPWQDLAEDDTRPAGSYPYHRQRCAGCPAATVQLGLQFPSPAGRYVNMMPFRLRDVESLPQHLAPYIPLINACLKISNYEEDDVGYLTIDERPTEQGKSQRRPGLHVESPGMLPLADGEEQVQMRNGTFIPGAEHHWGRGIMMRREKVTGGIFMASNVANTTAVWNCQINDERGDLIGPHGDIERLRPLLGPPSHLLEAGELVWITDRTPHESLPVPPAVGWFGRSYIPQRQYFRLVLGEVTAWYADHSTPSETGVPPPSSVRIVHGDKFLIYPKLAPRYQHLCTAAQISDAYALQELRLLLCLMGLGHIYEPLRDNGVVSVDELLAVTQRAGAGRECPLRAIVRNFPPCRGYGTGYYEIPAIGQLLEAAKLLQQEKGAPSNKEMTTSARTRAVAADLEMLEGVVEQVRQLAL